MAIQAQPSEIIKIDIFCRVIDNFGDAGVMWRLARSLTAEGFAVRLIIDDTDTLCALAGCPAKTPANLIGKDEAIDVVLWEKAWDCCECPLEPAEVVIEGFACRLPEDYERKMALNKPLWFNIDYFSAEDWIESCHLIPSIEPKTGLVKINYFPGVTPRSGSLVIEKDYEAQESLYKKSLSAKNGSDSLRVFFFAYPYGPIESMADAMIHCGHKLEVSVSQCEAGSLLSDKLLKSESKDVTVKTLSFVAQKAFDQLLWASDIAFVRGEDSAARAMIAGTPFLWHIYHQDDDVHMVKLKALEERFEKHFSDKALFAAWCELQEKMNNGTFDCDLFKVLLEKHAEWQKASVSFAHDLRALGSLAAKLSELIRKR